MFSLFTGDDKDQDFSEDLHKSFDAETSTHHMGETSSLYEEGPTECTKLSETQRTQNGNFGQNSLFRYNSKPYFMKKRQFFVLNAFDTIKMSALESRTILLRCLKLMVSQKSEHISYVIRMKIYLTTIMAHINDSYFGDWEQLYCKADIWDIRKKPVLLL